MNSIALSEERDMETSYGYCNDYQPHAVKRMFDYKNEMLYDMRWDEAGNLGQVSMGRPGEMFEKGRFLFWTEDCCGCEHRLCQSNVVSNRMHAAVDDKYFSYYVYDHSGGSCASREQSQACLSYAEMEQRRRSQRRLKLTGDSKLLDVCQRLRTPQNKLNEVSNADLMATYTVLNEPTLYPSSYMVLTPKGYTKHYFEEGRRVCSKLGGWFLWRVPADDILKPVEEVKDNYEEQHNQQRQGVHETLGKCIGAWPELIDKYDLLKMLLEYKNDEKNFYYHSDHLGSAAYLTSGGDVTQTLNYLPYGEDWIDVQNNMDPRLGQYRFNGKEKDYESGFHYYGARYYWSEVLTGWLSVDPMMDRYPFISPYAYCAWNPIVLSDPDGDSVILSDDARIIHEKYYNINKTYTDVYNQLNDPSNNTLFVFGKKGDTPDINNATEGGTVVDYLPPDEGVDPYEDFAGDIYLVQWGEARPELGGDESHVFLEEMYHAKQILDYSNNIGTIEKEVRAKEFAVKVNPNVIHSCKSNGYENVPTQLSIIQGFNYSESSKFLKEGMRNVRVKNVWGGWEYGSIPGAYKDFPWK